MKKSWLIFGFLFSLVLVLGVVSAVDTNCYRGELEFRAANTGANCASGVSCDGQTTTSPTCKYSWNCLDFFNKGNSLINYNALEEVVFSCPLEFSDLVKHGVPCDGQKTTSSSCKWSSGMDIRSKGCDIVSAPLSTQIYKCPNKITLYVTSGVSCEGQYTTASSCYWQSSASGSRNREDCTLVNREIGGDCRYNYTCGDGIPETPEGCDDGNSNDIDACSNSCEQNTLDTYYRDADGDGFGNPSNSLSAYSLPAGYVTNNGDCDDSRAEVNPGSPEICGNGLDDDCLNGDDVCPPMGCGLPWGGTINNGQTVTAYSSSTVPCGSSCESETRTCNDGTLTGSYTAGSCSAVPCASCNQLPWVGAINHGDSEIAYQSSTVPCGSSCNGETRTCNDGTLSGGGDEQSCVVESCGPFSGSFWTNLRGESTSAAQKGDTILMVTNLTNSLGPGQYIEYEVGASPQGGIFGFFSKIWEFITGGSSDTVTANHYVLDSDGSLTFTAKIMNDDGTFSGDEQESSDLNVESDIFNSRPSVSISDDVEDDSCPDAIKNIFPDKIPKCIEKGELVYFGQSTSDEDDLLNVRFDFESGNGDEQNFEFYALAYNGSDSLNVDHIFTKSEYKNVEIKVSEVDSSRGQTRVDSIPFFVFEPGINVFAVITNPEDGAVEEQLVSFNASQSFVTNCSTVANPGSFNVDGLNCEFIHFPGSRNYNSDDYSLNVEWRYLYEGGVGFDREGDWKTNYESGEAELGVVEFTHLFSSARGHRVLLNIEYNGV